MTDHLTLDLSDRRADAPVDPAADPAQGLVRVSVAAGSRRVDLALPGEVPVVELVPEVVRHLGLLEAATVHGGHRLAVPDGRVLAGGLGLAAQGVEDGALLVVTSRLDDVPPRVHDDEAEALSEAVEQGFAPWRAADSRRTTLATATLLLALGAVAMMLHGGGTAGAAAAGVAVVLLAGSTVLDRAGRDGAGVLVLLATPWAAVAGMLVVPGPWPGWGWPPADSFFSAPVAGAGAGVLVAGLAGLLGMRERRGRALPALVLGAVVVANGAAMLLVRAEPALVWLTTTTVLVLTGSVLPWLALGAAGTRTGLLPDPSDPPDAPASDGDGAGGGDGPVDGPVDVGRLAAGARVGHDVLLAVSVSVGVVVVLGAPLAVGRGVSGTLLAVTWCLVVLLRATQHHARVEVLTGLVSGVLGLASVALAVLSTHPGWRAGAALLLLAGGAAALLAAVLPTRPSPRRGWLAEVLEAVALLSLLPLMVVANGALGRVLG
jgi:type VII secretion integral membrane protein EccD